MTLPVLGLGKDLLELAVLRDEEPIMPDDDDLSLGQVVDLVDAAMPTYTGDAFEYQL